MNFLRLYGLILLVLGLFLFSSCSTDETEPDLSQSVDKSRYYVKYEVTFSTQHVNTVKNVSFTTEKGTEKISFTEWTNTKSWEGTYGPVDKDFKASIDCAVPNYKYESTIHARIYLSRDKEPFVIKAEGSGKYSLSLETKIDF